MQSCPDDASGASGCEIGGENFKHRAERGAQNETFAPMPSFRQSYTSIN
jgi:hypothetical protein